MLLLMFEDMYFTILDTYLLTESPFLTSVFTLMGLSCVYIIIIIKGKGIINKLKVENEIEKGPF